MWSGTKISSNYLGEGYCRWYYICISCIGLKVIGGIVSASAFMRYYGEGGYYCLCSYKVVEKECRVYVKVSALLLKVPSQRLRNKKDPYHTNVWYGSLRSLKVASKRYYR